MSFGVAEPVPLDLGTLLRRAVLDHVSTERRRVFDPVAHVGVPGAQVARLELQRDDLDHALRIDALEAMVRRVQDDAADLDTALLVWLTRPGALDLQDVDVDWAGAARSAALELTRVLVMVVVTRRGWHDPTTGATRTWRRLRPVR